MIFQFFSNSMIFPCMELFFVIFQVFQCSWEPCYLPQTFGQIEARSNSVNPDQTAPEGAVV